jgi:hypothetical protein
VKFSKGRDGYVPGTVTVRGLINGKEVCQYNEGYEKLFTAGQKTWREYLYFAKVQWSSSALRGRQNSLVWIMAISVHVNPMKIMECTDFFAWYKQFLMPETEKYIYLENTHRNPLSDDELAKRLAEKFGV